MEGLDGLTDDELVERLHAEVSRERESTAAVLRCLILFEQRSLAEKKACSTLFGYCTQRLGYSEGGAYRRINAARRAADFPLILDLLEGGLIHLSAVSVLGPHLTAENHKDLLQAARGKRKIDLEFLAASLKPRTIERTVIRPEVPLRPAAPAEFASELVIHRPARLEPLSAETIRIAFTSTRASFEKLQRAKELLRHKFPFGAEDQIFDQALEDLLDKRDPERRIKRKKAERRERAGRSEGGRRIPQWVRDEVWERDGGRCSFTGQDGQRCPGRAFLEYDHIIPFALGGPSDTPKNVRLLCRSHNQDAGRQLFGGSSSVRSKERGPA